MSISEILSLLGGIALFLFGISLMGDGLKQVSGNKLEPVLYKLSGTPARGMLLGTGVTAVIQSSSATAVMTVGIVSSGMMKLRQAVGVTLGAILGTSITGWVICLSYIEGAGDMAQLVSTTTLTGLVAVIGILLRMAAKKQSGRHVGDIMMGFAVLMFGMSAMSGSVSGLRELPWFTSVLTSLSNPFLGILFGALFAAVLQSASAAVGIVQALSVTGAMSFDAALPLLLGISFGASFPVLIAAVGAKAEGKRAAFVYPLATGAGVVVCAAVYYALQAVLGFSLSALVMTPFSLALVNTLMRLAMLLLLLPFTRLLVRAATALVRDDAEQDGPAIRLEESLLRYPPLAIEQAGDTTVEMAGEARRALERSLALLSEFSQKGFDEVQRLEARVDDYEDALGTYLIKLTGREMSDEQNKSVSIYLHTLTDFERISDHALNLAESAQELHETGSPFSDAAKHELEVLRKAVNEVARMTIDAFTENDLHAAARVEPLEELIDELCDRMKLNHVERLQHGQCTISKGFIFNDIITNCERVSDHCSNVAVALIELNSDVFHTHEYTHSLREKGSPEFQKAYEEFAARFVI